MRTTMLAGLALALPAEALACGGFFCDNAAPVDQSGERILFVVDEEAGKVDVHVQITYEGPSEEFAWLLPAPADLYGIRGVPTLVVDGRYMTSPGAAGGYEQALAVTDFLIEKVRAEKAGN